MKYKIPASVQKAAKQGLALRAEYKRGGTKVGLNTARVLSAGGEIGFEKVKHISEYFPRHEVDKKGKDWDKPSNGKIAWLLWGGDAGWKWAKAIVAKNKQQASDGRTNMSIHEKIEAAFGTKEAAGTKQVVALDSKWLNKLKGMTKQNAHSEVLVELTRYLLTLNPKSKSYKSMATSAENFLDAARKRGYVSMEDSANRYELLKKVEAALAKHLNNAQVKQLRECY